MTRVWRPDLADPREREDALGWVTRAVFPDPRIWLRLARDAAAPPAGIRLAAGYVVAPSAGRARFLLPVGSRRMTAASVLAYNALRPPAVRVARGAVGVLARLGATRLARMPVLQVGVPSGVDGREVLLVDRLAARLGQSRLYAALGVPTPDPNYKPTLQLFDGAGTPCGYAKLGWNGATRALVRTELRALSALADRAAPPGPAGAAFPHIPRLLAGLEWAGHTVAVIEPLPREVRRLPGTAPPRLPELLAVARRGGAATPRKPFGDSPFAARLAATAAQASAAQAPLAPSSASQVSTGLALAAGGQRLQRAVRALVRRDHDTTVEFGAWHGDWVPWNLGRLAGGRVAAWDWEHSGEGVPVGFDLVHQGFQSALILDRVDAATAAGAAERLLARYGADLDLDPVRQRLLVDAYLVELWSRTWRLASAGAGWNAALHPALLSVLEHRLP